MAGKNETAIAHSRFKGLQSLGKMAFILRYLKCLSKYKVTIPGDAYKVVVLAHFPNVVSSNDLR